MCDVKYVNMHVFAMAVCRKHPCVITEIQHNVKYVLKNWSVAQSENKKSVFRYKVQCF
jgi:hypothetical protein